MLPAPSGTHPTPPDPSAEPPDPYEFTAGQNAVFSALGAKMHFVGLFVIAIGVMALAAGVARSDLGLLVVGALYSAFGYWTERAGASFRSVAVTRGHDIRHLMDALEDLRKCFTLQYWICIALIVAALVLLGTTAAAAPTDAPAQSQGRTSTGAPLSTS